MLVTVRVPCNKKTKWLRTEGYLPLQYLAQVTEVSKFPPEAAFISNLWTTFSSKEEQKQTIY